jgi:oligopeptide/dipeptide ABC transporter ATP-binding protein
VLDLLKELQDELGVAILFITHDLGVVADMADDVAVMYAGQIVEHASAQVLFDAPRHPYTSGLLGAIPDVSSAKAELGFIAGQVPKPSEWGVGCRFAGRCPHAAEICMTAVELRPAGMGEARCARIEELVLTGALLRG